MVNTTSINRFAVMALAASLAALMTACGGGGGGGADAPVSGGNPAAASAPAPAPPAPPAASPAPPTIASAQGLYEGTIGSRMAGTIVLESGRYYVLYAQEKHPELIAGVVVGDLSIGAGGNTFTSSNMRDYNLETMRRFYGNLAGTFTPKGQMAGTATSGTNSVTFAGTYSKAYEAPATLPAVAGTYTGDVGTQFGVESMTLKILPNGALSGTSQTGCNIHGGMGPAGGGNAAYALQFTFGQGCKLYGTNYSGHAILTRGTLLRAVATAPDLSDLALFVGSKPAGSVQ